MIIRLKDGSGWKTKGLSNVLIEDGYVHYLNEDSRVVKVELSKLKQIEPN